MAIALTGGQPAGVSLPAGHARCVAPAPHASTPLPPLQTFDLAIARPWLRCDQTAPHQTAPLLLGAQPQVPRESHHVTPQAALACFGIAPPQCIDAAPKQTLARRLLGMLLGDAGSGAARTSAGPALATAGTDEGAAMAAPLRARVDASEPPELRLQHPFHPASDVDGTPQLFVVGDPRQALPGRDVRSDQPTQLVGYAPVPGVGGVPGGVDAVDDDADGSERPRWLFAAFDAATRRLHLVLAGLLLSTLVAAGMWVIGQLAR